MSKLKETKQWTNCNTAHCLKVPSRINCCHQKKPQQQSDLLFCVKYIVHQRKISYQKF